MREIKNNDGFVPGMLTEMIDLKILICYLLNTVKEPVEKDIIVDVICANDISDYFAASSAIFELVENGSLNEDKESNLILTDKGASAADELESALPLTVRKKAVESAIELLTISKREKQHEVKFEKVNDGVFVVCKMTDGKDELLSFRLFVADEMQAKTVKTNFLANPTKVYKAFIDALIK